MTFTNSELYCLETLETLELIKNISTQLITFNYYKTRGMTKGKNITKSLNSPKFNRPKFNRPKFNGETLNNKITKKSYNTRKLSKEKRYDEQSTKYKNMKYENSNENYNDKYDKQNIENNIIEKQLEYIAPHIPPHIMTVQVYSNEQWQNLYMGSILFHMKPRCQSCGTSETPQWRRGWPHVSQKQSEKNKNSRITRWDCVTLCNACGIRYNRVFSTYPHNQESFLTIFERTVGYQPPKKDCIVPTLYESSDGQEVQIDFRASYDEI